MVEENRVPYVYTEFGEGVTTVVFISKPIRYDYRWEY